MRVLVVVALALASCDSGANQRGEQQYVLALQIGDDGYLSVGGARTECRARCQHLRIVGMPSREPPILHIEKAGHKLALVHVTSADAEWLVFTGRPTNERTGGARRPLRCRAGKEIRCAR